MFQYQANEKSHHPNCRILTWKRLQAQIMYVYKKKIHPTIQVIVESNSLVVT
jgi:hypothetical protein